MGSVGTNKAPQISRAQSLYQALEKDFYNILEYRRDYDGFAQALAELNRPLKKNEFGTTSVYVGSRIQGGMQYGYEITPPKDFPTSVVYTRTSSKSVARKLIGTFVDKYNEWYERSK